MLHIPADFSRRGRQWTVPSKSEVDSAAHMSFNLIFKTSVTGIVTVQVDCNPARHYRCNLTSLRRGTGECQALSASRASTSESLLSPRPTHHLFARPTPASRRLRAVYLLLLLLLLFHLLAISDFQNTDNLPAHLRCHAERDTQFSKGFLSLSLSTLRTPLPETTTTTNKKQMA